MSFCLLFLPETVVFVTYLHCVLAAVQCVVIGPVCLWLGVCVCVGGCVGASVTTITRYCAH